MEWGSQTMNHPFQFKIDGANIRPNTLRVADLFAFLKSLDQGISTTAESDGIPTADAEIFLTAITEGSADCVLEIPDRGYNSAIRFTRAVASRDLSLLPKRARDSVFALQKKARQFSCTLSISSPNGLPTAQISPSTEFFADALIEGYTTLSGTLLRVGGDDPTAQLRLFDNSRITADVADQNLAVHLAKLLYKTVSVEGIASWIAGTWSIFDFKIQKITTYSDASDVVETLAALAEIASGVWSNIDPDEYIAEMRAE